MFGSITECTYYSRKRDLKLYYCLWKPIHPAGLLLFLHGAGEHSRQYAHLGKACLSRNIVFVAPDLRGFGKSEGLRGYIQQFRDYLDDLDELFIQLKNRFSNLPFFLFGHSLGGLIAIRYAQQFCDKVSGVILSSPALGIRMKLPYPLKKCMDLLSLLVPAFPMELVRWNESLRKLKWFRSRLPDWTSQLLQDPLATIRFTPRWVTELLKTGTMALEEVNSFRVPVLCLYDRYDTVVNAHLIEQFIENIPSKDKECSAYANGNHQMLHNGEVLKQIFQWMDRRLIKK